MTVDKAEVRDPAKAHEYYVKNRELKGREAGKVETKGQRQARVYADKQIGAKKRTESKSLTTSQKAQLQKLRSTAEASRKRIEEKLNQHLAKLNVEKQEPLFEIPTNASPAVREYLNKQNARISKKNEQIVSNNKVATKVRAEARAEMQRVGTELKAAVATARQSYAKAKTDLNTKYKTASDTEHKNIAANVK
jgi:hypothetical protein